MSGTKETWMVWAIGLFKPITLMYVEEGRLQTLLVFFAQWKLFVRSPVGHLFQIDRCRSAICRDSVSFFSSWSSRQSFVGDGGHAETREQPKQSGGDLRRIAVRVSFSLFDSEWMYSRCVMVTKTWPPVCIFLSVLSPPPRMVFSPCSVVPWIIYNVLMSLCSFSV